MIYIVHSITQFYQKVLLEPTNIVLLLNVDQFQYILDEYGNHKVRVIPHQIMTLPKLNCLY